jgi:hypothetical protein
MIPLFAYLGSELGGCSNRPMISDKDLCRMRTLGQRTTVHARKERCA